MIHAAYPKLYTRTTVPQYTKLKQIHQKVIDMAIDAGLKEGQASSIANIFIRGKEVDTPVRWAQMVSDLFSDVMFVCPTYEFANKLTSLNVTTYLYLFAQQAKNSAWGEWMKVTHHDEVSFIMGYPLRYQHDYSRDDIDISYQMIKTWAGFAKTGYVYTIHLINWCHVNNGDIPLSFKDEYHKNNIRKCGGHTTKWTSIICRSRLIKSNWDRIFTMNHAIYIIYYRNISIRSS